MVEKGIVKNLIIEYQQNVKEKDILYRQHNFDDNSNYVLVGIRRAGKSFLLFQDIQKHLKEKTFTEESFLYINFEDERLSDIESKELGILLECYNELYPQLKPWIYLDEIQLIDGWERFARRIADQGYRIMITGSNAKMLSHEIASTLGGRYIPHEVFPFSFVEYLQYRGLNLSNNWQFDKKQLVNIRNFFTDYFYYGGFAENFNRQDKREWLNSLYQKILLGDIIARNSIRNPRIFRLLVRKITESIGQPISQSRLHNIIKSTGENISIPILKDYLDYIQEAYLTFSFTNLASPLSERSTIVKRYCIDNGLLNIFYTSAEGKLLENLVAISLQQKYSSTEDPLVFYYNKNIEVDFCIPVDSLAIQVCLNINDPATFERECKALDKFVNAFKQYRGIIITLDDERTITTNTNKVVEVVPIWKWLLQMAY